VLKKYAYDKLGNRYVAHPTSKTVFEDWPVPEWQAILDVAKRTQEALFLYSRMLGLDIALNQKGEPVLIEVNRSPDLVFQEQTSGPLFRNSSILEAFAAYDLLVNKYQRRLYDSVSAGHWANR